MLRSRTFPDALLLALLLSCSSCGGDPQSNDNGTESAPRQFALPAPSSLSDMRIAASSYGVVLSTEYDQTVGALHISDEVGGNRLMFSPLAGPPQLENCSFAIYRVPVDDGGDLQIDFTWFVTPEPGSLYVGLGNQPLDRWDWTAKFDATEPFEPGAVDDYLAADSTMLVSVLILPSGNVPQLDYFHVETTDASGWQFVKLTQVELNGTWDPRGSLDAEIVGGRPAIAYSVMTGPNFEDQAPNLIVSSTADGADSADWSSNSLDPAKFVFADLEDISGGFGIYNSLDSKYFYSADPAGPYSEEDISLTTTGFQTPFERFGAVAGKPAIVYFDDGDVLLDSNYIPRYYASDAVSGGTWVDCPVSLDTEVNTVVLPHVMVSNLVDHDGKPAFAFEENTLGMVVASADQAIPSVISDWTITALGGGSGGRLKLFHAGSTLTLCDGTVLSTPDKFSVYQFTGTDITQTADWTIVHVDSLGLGNVANWGFGSFGSTVAAWPMYTNLAGNTLGGSSDPVRQYTCASPTNVPADWQMKTLSSDIETNSGLTTSIQFVEANGQPAYAYWYGEKSGTADPDARGRATLVWAHFVP